MIPEGEYEKIIHQLMIDTKQVQLKITHLEENLKKLWDDFYKGRK